MKLMKNISLFISLFVFFLGINTVAAQDKDKKAKDKKLKVTIFKVKGDVEVKSNKDAKWVKAKKGMVIVEGGGVSTSFDSSVYLKFEDYSYVVVKDMTQIKITKFLKKKATVKTNINLKIGTVKIRVKKGDFKSDFKVSNPVCTASVKGSEWEETALHNKVLVGVKESNVKLKDIRNRTRSYSPGEEGDNRLFTAIDNEKLKYQFFSGYKNNLIDSEINFIGRVMKDQLGITPGKTYSSTKTPKGMKTFASLKKKAAEETNGGVEYYRYQCSLWPSCSTQFFWSENPYAVGADCPECGSPGSPAP